ncbi:hypothetical protein ES708_02722 [subsurface metagenome]
MKRTKAGRAKTLEAVADGARLFLEHLEAVDLPDAERSFRKQLERLPARLVNRVNRATEAFERCCEEVKDLLVDLDCAASDAD